MAAICVAALFLLRPMAAVLLTSVFSSSPLLTFTQTSCFSSPRYSVMFLPFQVPLVIYYNSSLPDGDFSAIEKGNVGKITSPTHLLS